MKIILSLADPQLVELACHSKADMIRIGPFPGEDLQAWEADEIMTAINLIEESGKSAQVRLPVYPRSGNTEIGSLLEKLAANPDVELIIGAWHQIRLEIPNPKVAGENLNITNSDEVSLLSREGVHTVTFAPRWSPSKDFWGKVPESSRFESHIKGPVHVGWLCLDGHMDTDLTPLPSAHEGPGSFYIKRGQLWSKSIYPVQEPNPLITRNIIEYFALDELTENPS